jgi:eukaryotic-like serine/threonine-protein kinase
MTVLSDRYELGATLGAGGMARVVEAHDRVLDRRVAVKLLRDDIATDPAVRERFLREARTAAKFTHPNAVTVYDTGQDGRQPWIVMELVRGEDLSRRLTLSGRLDESEAVRITDAVLAALEAAHRDGMVHRDVKPGNIMLLDDGGVKLADFGIAKSVQDATAGMTATGQIIGTAKYLSPEQVEGHPATPASDAYATGVVLYEMLAGDPPFTGDTAIAVALAHTRDPIPDIRRAAPGISPVVAAVVERSLAKEPAQRFADAGEMRRALRGERVATTAVLAAGTPTEVLPVGRRRGAAEEPPPRRTLLWALIALGALALIGGLALANANRSPEVAPTEAPADEITEPPAQDEPEQTAPAEPEPTEQAPPETQAPPVEPELIEPTDLPTLITQLEAHPARFGPRQDDLRKDLEKVVNAGDDSDKQGREAQKALERVRDWEDDGELDPRVAAWALMFLEPLAAQADDDDD